MVSKGGKSSELFSMYDGLEITEEVPLKGISGNPGNGATIIKDDSETLRSVGYKVSRTFEVPDGTYSVGVKLRTKGGEKNPHTWWFFMAQHEQISSTPGNTIPRDWLQYYTELQGDGKADAGALKMNVTSNIIDVPPRQVEVKNGILEMEIVLGWLNEDSAYLDWVEFRYEKVD